MTRAEAGPLVSIGVPVHNNQGTLRATLESLVAQASPRLEIVVSDNASRDATGAICAEFAARDARIRYVRQPRNLGGIRNFLEVLELARGAFFTWTAGDDLRPPGAIGALALALERQPAAVMAHGPVIARLSREGRDVPVSNAMDLSGPDPARRVATFTRMLRHNAILFGLYRRDAIRRAVYGAHMAMDYLFCLQVCAAGPIAYIDEPMLVYDHRWGPVDNPMYAREPVTLRDLLIHRGVRRRKCWHVLVKGARYVVRAAAGPPRDRRRAAAAHVAAFVGRYHAELLTEIPFLATSPLARAFGPLVPQGRRLVHAWQERPRHGV
jgi:glycosyltransferase involved in cell wall biosynthesis